MVDLVKLLQTIGLSQYSDILDDNDIDGQIIGELTDDDLKDLGISLGHRRKLLKAIKEIDNTKQEVPAEETSFSESVPTSQPSRLPKIEAERRQLTVMFCDLVGSTALSASLDPEDMRDVIASFQGWCTEAIRRYDGHIAKFMGDAVLAYFGYPFAHEDDPERAVRAALNLVTSSERLAQTAGQPLQVRVGIDTGLVVVGDLIGEGAAQERAVVGDTPNLAARLQSAAEPNTVLISENTRKLLGTVFVSEDRGQHELKGFADPIQVWQVVDATETESRFEGRQTGDQLTPFIGREEEIALLLHRWEQTLASEGQVALLCGEPGIGKSRITQTFRERIAAHQHRRLQYQCSPFFTNSAFYPVTDHLERAIRMAEATSTDMKLDVLEALLNQSGMEAAETVPLFADLLSLPTDDRYPPLDLSPQRQRERTVAAFAEYIEGLAGANPAFVIFEDIHWADPTTLEALDHLVSRIGNLPVFLLATYRPEFQNRWEAYAHVTPFLLNRLSKSDSADMVHRVAGKPIPATLGDQIVQKTDGVPLFVEELTKAVIESAMVDDRGDRFEISGTIDGMEVPATLHDSLMARLDRLIPVKEVAQIGAAIGREFTYRLMEALSPMGRDELDAALDKLIDSQLVYQRGRTPEATYIFKHALVQDAAYNSLLRRDRLDLHEQIAVVLLANFPELADTEPELLAHHYTSALNLKEAIPYWLRAGQRAIDRSAFTEAASHFSEGLNTTRLLPEGIERDQHEMKFQAGLGTANLTLNGWGSQEAGQAYQRAMELSHGVKDPQLLLNVFWGTYVFEIVRGNIHETENRIEEMLKIAKEINDPDLTITAQMTWITTRPALGQFEVIRNGLPDFYKLYIPERHSKLVKTVNHDPKAVTQAWAAHSVWMLGYPDEALRLYEEQRRTAEEQDHLFQIAFSRVWATYILVFRRDWEHMRDVAEEARKIAEKETLKPILALSFVLKGVATAHLGAMADGISMLENGISGWDSAGGRLSMPIFRCWLAELLGMADRLDEGFAQLQLIEEQIAKWGEVTMEAELERLKGELMLRRSGADAADAETHFQNAIRLAQARKAKSWELRAGMSLARLWHEQGKSKEAYELLAPIYSWFVEGFDTQDLKDAKTLLNELAG